MFVDCFQDTFELVSITVEFVLSLWLTAENATKIRLHT